MYEIIDSSMQRLNSVEMDLFLEICEKIKEEYPKEICFSFSDLKGLATDKPAIIKRVADDLDRSFDKLVSLRYRSEDNGVRRQFILFPDYEIDLKNQLVKLSISKNLEHLLPQLIDQVTRLESGIND